MKKILFSWGLWTCLLCLSVGKLQAQDQPLVDPNDSIRSLVGRLFPNYNADLSAHMNLQFSTAGVANFEEGSFEDASFKLNRVKLEILGTFSKQFSYHFRQSYNKYSNPHSLDNLSSSIELALVNWKLTDCFTLTAGKQSVAMGGYEFYVSAIKVREFSEFNDRISCYQAGLAGTIQLSPTQELVLQVVNNRSGESEETYVYGLPQDVKKAKVPVLSTLNWNGFFFDRTLQLRYASSYGQLAEGRNAFYLTSGTIYEKGPVIAYLDLMYSREGLDSKGIVSELQGPGIVNPVTAQNVEYFTAIANFDYRIHPHWNVYVKGAYERSSIYEANGDFDKGLYRTSWNAQACVEYFPMRNKELQIFAHFLYKGTHLTDRGRALGGFSPDRQRVSLGLVYAIPVF